MRPHRSTIFASAVVASRRKYRAVAVGTPGSQVPVVCIELRPGVARSEWPRVEQELRALADANPVTNGIGRFLLHSRFPLDIRHNAKILRERLAAWAARRIATGAAGEAKEPR